MASYALLLPCFSVIFYILWAIVLQALMCWLWATSGLGEWAVSSLQLLFLLCATAQQSYCRHAGVRPSVVRLSVDIARKSSGLTLYFCDKYLPTISRDIYFHNFKFLIFYDFFFVFVNIWEKKLYISSESTHQIHSEKKSCIFLKSCCEIWISFLLFFAICYSFFFFFFFFFFLFVCFR